MEDKKSWVKDRRRKEKNVNKKMMDIAHSVGEREREERGWVALHFSSRGSERRREKSRVLVEDGGVRYLKILLLFGPVIF